MFEIELNEESKEINKLVGLRAESELLVMKGTNFQNLWPFCQRILKDP